jgi:hypothetical protein
MTPYLPGLPPSPKEIIWEGVPWIRSPSPLSAGLLGKENDWKQPERRQPRKCFVEAPKIGLTSMVQVIPSVSPSNAV